RGLPLRLSDPADLRHARPAAARPADRGGRRGGVLLPDRRAVRLRHPSGTRRRGARPAGRHHASADNRVALPAHRFLQLLRQPRAGRVLRRSPRQGAAGMTTPGLRTPAQMFEMMLAYKTTALLTTGIELGVFDALAESTGTAAELAGRLSLSERGSRLLLNGLAALGLLESVVSSYGLADGSEALQLRGRPGNV